MFSKNILPLIISIILAACSEEFNINGERIIQADLEPENWMAHGRT